MKHEAWRRHPGAYPVRSEIQPRYTDVDLWQHLNNGALIGLQIESVVRWLRTHLGDRYWAERQPALAPLQTQTDFIAEAFYPEPLQLGCRLLAVGPHGLRIGSALFQSGRCVGLHEALLVPWQAGQRRPLDPVAAEHLHTVMEAQPHTALQAQPADAAPDTAPPPHSHEGQPMPAPDDRLAPPPAPPAWPQPFRLATRFGDHDGQGQLSDFALARYAEQSRVQLLDRLMGAGRLEDPVGLMVAHVALRWFTRRKGPAELLAGCGVSRMGERSLTVRTAFFDGSEPIAEAESVMVVIHRESHRPMPAPERLRAAAQPLLMSA